MQPQDPTYPPTRSPEPGDQPAAMPQSWQPPQDTPAPAPAYNPFTAVPATSQPAPTYPPQPQPAQPDPSQQLAVTPIPAQPAPSAPYGTPQYVDPTPQLPQPQAPTPDYATPQYNQYNNSQPQGGVIRLLLIGLVSLVALGSVVGAGYFLYQSYGPDSRAAPPADLLETEEVEQQKAEEQAPRTTAATTLHDVALIPPTDLSRYKANTDNTNTTMSYTTSDDRCTLQIGVVASSALPGKDVAAVVAQRVQALRAQGATVDEPRKGDTLIVADVANADKRYHLETRVFTATEGTKQTLYHYSAAILKGGKRLYVSRSCNNPSGAVEQTMMEQLNADAATITLRPIKP